MKPLMNRLHSKKGQERTLPSLLWMRYKAVEQETLSFADLSFGLAFPSVTFPSVRFRFAGRSALQAWDSASRAGLLAATDGDRRQAAKQATWPGANPLEWKKGCIAATLDITGGAKFATELLAIALLGLMSIAAGF